MVSMPIVTSQGEICGAVVFAHFLKTAANKTVEANSYLYAKVETNKSEVLTINITRIKK